MTGLPGFQEPPEPTGHRSTGPQPSLAGRLFSTQGRATRTEYFLHTFLDAFVILTLLVLIRAIGRGLPLNWRAGFIQAASVVVLSLASWAQIAVVIRRLNDLNRPRREWVLMFCPIYNLYFGCVLLFSRSARPRNDPISVLETALEVEAAGRYEEAFELYRSIAVLRRGHPDSEVAIACIRRLHQRLDTDPDSGELDAVADPVRDRRDGLAAT